jgi:hypothetical protein
LYAAHQHPLPSPAISHISKISPVLRQWDLVTPRIIARPRSSRRHSKTGNKVHHALKSLNLLPISYWFEIKDLTFYYKCKSGGYEVDIDQYSTQPSLHTTCFSSSDVKWLESLLTSITANYLALTWFACKWLVVSN